VIAERCSGLERCEMADVSRDHDLDRIRGEFTEMPGLRLTAPQARRFFGVDEETCTRILDALITERFLCRFRLETYGVAPGGLATSASLRSTAAIES